MNPDVPNVIKKIIIISSGMMYAELGIAVEKQKDIPQTIVSDPVGISNYIQMMLGLVVVVVFILGLAWFLRRIMNIQPNINGALKVISGLNIGQKEKILVIQASDEQFLVGVTSSNIRLISKLEKTIQGNTHTETGEPNFLQRLNAAMKGVRK